MAAQCFLPVNFKYNEVLLYTSDVIRKNKVPDNFNKQRYRQNKN